ncbi:MAG: serine/threonine protein kinase [Gemmataceae bacterium]|nr:serine/threonine protein kinase [Gemmataceae bacterium]
MAGDSSVVLIPSGRSRGPHLATRVDPGATDHCQGVNLIHAGRDRFGRLPVITGYEVRAEIGKGGMGTVYEAVDLTLHRPVALKLLAENLLTRPDHRLRFCDEAEAVARLDHPNIVRIFKVGEYDGRPYLVLELVRGGSLADRLSAVGRLPVPETLALIRALARAVQHAHDRGVIHRDLKPANVLLTGDELAPGSPDRPLPGGRPKLTDFGLARLLDHDRVRTRTGMLLGTPCYMAPEVVEDGHRAVSPAVDVYGLGAILYECLTGRPPVDGRTTWEILRQVVDSDPEPPGRARPGLDRGLDAVCLKALAKDPAHRYPSVTALADDLDRVAAGRSVRVRIHGPGYHLLRHARRRPWAAALGAAALTLAVGLGSLTALHHRERCREGREAGRLGQDLLARGAYAEAEQVFAHGLQRVEGLPWAGDLMPDLVRHKRLSRRGRQAVNLHQLVDKLRFGYDVDSLAGSDLRAVTQACETLWRLRDQLAAPGETDLGPDPERQLRTDLLDLALLSADFRVRDGGGSPSARRAALRRIDEAEGALGPAVVLARAREVHLSALGEPAGLPPVDPPSSPWDVYALGRSRLNAGDLEGAEVLLRQAVDRDPGGFWPNYHSAVCAARRGRAEEAVSGFSACLAVARDRRGLCHYNRGLAYMTLGRADGARNDFDRALELEPTLAEAALNRGLLHHQAKRFTEAAADLEQALRDGYSPAVVNYNLALVHRSAGNRAAAETHAVRAAQADPGHPGARALVDQLKARR